MKKSIYIFSNGELHRKQNTLYFQKEDGGKKYLPVENIGEFLIFGEVTINKKLLEFLSQNEIILHFFNYYGYYVGSYYPREHYNSGFMILKQSEFYLDKDKRLDLARRFVKGAIINMKKVLSYYINRAVDLNKERDSISSLEKKIESQIDIDALMAIEGNVREIYYKCFNKILDNSDFKISERTRRPPENRLNALISFGNSILYTIILSEIYKTHLDPRIGFLHTTNFRRFTLNLDIAEIFKPIIVDRVIFYLVNKNMVQKKHFQKELKGIYLNEKGREIFIREMDKRLNTTIFHKKIGKRLSYRSIIRAELYKLEKHLINDEIYEPFISEW